MEANQPSEWTLHILSNTHWDREWYFSFERSRWRLVKLFDRLLDLLENQADYQPFLLDGQFIPIQDYLEMRPGQRTRVEHLVKTGRLQIGPWYTQPLETIASGEAMVRNLMLGIQRSMEMGMVSRIGYMIDEFGHVSQLPQICRGFGIEDIVIWRGVPKGMKSLFRWAGSDGSAIGVFYSNSGYGEATALPEDPEDHIETLDWTPQYRLGLKNRIQGLLDLRTPNAATHHLMALNGIDHSFAQENLSKVLYAAQDMLPGARLVHSTLAAYILAVKTEVAQNTIPLQTHNGELLDSNESVLKDIHSFRCEQKALNRQVETLLEKWAEPFACLAWLAGYPYPQEGLWKAWEYVLQNHSHDSLGCSSVDEVYRHVMGRYEWAVGLAREISEESLHFLSRQPAMVEDQIPLVVFNPSSWAREEWLTATLDLPISITAEDFSLFEDEQEIPYTLLEQKETFRLRYNPQRGHPTRTPVRQVKISFYTRAVPALGYKLFQLTMTSPQLRPLPALCPQPGRMENEFLSVKINPNGTYDLHDKTTGAIFYGLGYVEDSGEAGDGYNHVKPEQDEIFTSLLEKADVKLIRDDGLTTEVEILYHLALPKSLDETRTRRSDERVACKITQNLLLHRTSRRLDVCVSIDNRALDHRLRLVFPTQLNSEYSWAAMPFEVVKRAIAMPDISEYSGETPRPTHPQHQFVDVNDEKIGLMIANRGLYEYEVIDDPSHSIALTLLRCTDRLDSGSLGVIDEMKMPLGQELGLRSFHYSLIPHAGSWETAVNQADEFAVPLEALIPRKLEMECLPGYELPALTEASAATMEGFIDLQPSCLVMSALKKHHCENAVVVRALNRSDQPIRGRLKLKWPGGDMPNVWASNLAEDLLAPLSPQQGAWIETDIPAWGLWTTVWSVADSTITTSTPQISA